MNDEQLLAAVRAVDPLVSHAPSSPDPLLGRVLEAARSESAPKRRRLHTRRLALVGAVAVAFAVAAPAFGFGLTRLLNGSPAPPAVTSELTPGDGQQPPVSAEVQLTTSQGYTATLYATHLNGRDCTYVRVTDESANVGVRGIALCPQPVPASAISVATSGGMKVDGSWVTFAYGHVASNVASAAIQFGDGHQTALPLSNGYFLHELVTGETGPMTLVASDAAGNEVAQRQIPGVRTAP